MNINDLDIAYCAGLFEGEGSLLLAKGSKQTRKPRICVQMTDKGPLEKIANTFGGSVREKNPPSRANRNSLFSWEVEGQRAVDALNQMAPYFLIRRRKFLADTLIRYPFLGSGKRLTAAQSKERTHKIETMHRSMVRANRARSKPSLNRRTPVPPSATDWAYLAGYLDAEGWVRLPESTATTGSLAEISSTDPEVIRWIWLRFGGTVGEFKRGPKYMQHGKRHPSYVWRTGLSNLRKMIDGTAEHVQIPRKKDALIHWKTRAVMKNKTNDPDPNVPTPSRWASMFQ